MSRLIDSAFRLSDRVARVSDAASAATRARARALLIWTALAVPIGVFLILVTQRMNFLTAPSIGVLAGAAGMIFAVLRLRYTQKLDEASLIFVGGAFVGLGGAAWIERDPSLVPLIFLAATPVYFGLIVYWRQCLKYTLGLVVFLMALALWCFVRDGTAEDALLILACGLTALGIGLSTTAYAYTTARAAKKLQRQKAEIAELAYKDPLTGLLNRRAFNDFIARGRNHQSAEALAVVDLDGFKSINDRFGHEVGDEVLAELAARLSGVVKGTLRVFRLGGDEFVLTGDSSDGEPDSFGKQICKATAEPFMTSAGPLLIDISVGLSSSKYGASDYKQMFREADIALFEAKRFSGSRGVTFCDGLGSLKKRTTRISELLVSAIGDQSLSVAFQPQYQIERAEIVGFEALARWTTADFGTISPGEFIPIAERANLIVALDRSVFANAIRAAQSWLLTSQKVAINVSGSTLLSDGFVAYVEHVIRGSRLNCDQVQVEITETEIIKDKDDAAEICQQLRDLGVSIALDDFGTGYSSLSYLSSLPVNKLKVDRSFVQHCDQESNLKIMRSIVGLARSLGLQLIVEGVEKDWQLATIKELGCTYVQGFYFSRPLTAEQCARLNSRPPAAGGLPALQSAVA